MNNIEKVNYYDAGTEFWRDTLLRYGIDEGLAVCINYLSMQLKIEMPDDERHFCRGLFTAAYEATAGNVCAKKIVYPYPYEEAYKNTEASYYHASRSLNKECVRRIDELISDCCYKVNHYNLEAVAWAVILEYGFQRVNAVLAFHIQSREYDGRYSNKNKEWAKGFSVIEKAFDGAYLNAHATLVDSFANHIRQLYIDLDAPRFSLPGTVVSGETVHGYEIIRSIMLDGKNIAIGHNPNAVSPYVCWYFKITEDGERDYFWGVYGEEQEAVDKYTARVFTQIADGQTAEA